MALSDLIDSLKKGHIKIFNFEADFSKLSNLIKTGHLSLKLFSGNKIEKHLHIDNSKHLTINIDQLDLICKERLRDIVHELKNDGYTLLEDKSNKTLENILEEEKADASKRFLDFFKDKVSSQDLEIIRGALYIRSQFEKGERNVDILKSDIRQKYGQRGNNIVNLCTAGYFENYLMPYHEYLAKTEKDGQEVLRKFKAVFNILAEELPFTVFVCYKMSMEEVRDQIDSKFKYGAAFVNVHGIGAHNVTIIKEALEQIRQMYKERDIDIFIDEERKQVMKARIELKVEADEKL